MTFRDEMIKLIQENTPVQMVPCEVLKYDSASRTIEAKDLLSETEVYDVKLQGSPKLKEGFVLTPKVGSLVIVGIIGNDERNCIILGYSALESIELNGSDLGGLIKIKELKKQIDKNSSILNGILDVLNVEIVEAGNGAPSVFHKALKVALSGKSTADLSNIENEKVTHG